jgi:hypothetical protein
MHWRRAGHSPVGRRGRRKRERGRPMTLSSPRDLGVHMTMARPSTTSSQLTD